MRRLIPRLALLVGLLLPGDVSATEEIPRPALGEMEPHVQRQLRDARRQLDELLAAPDPERAPLAAALGLMGQLYHAYDLTEPAEVCYTRAARLAPNDYRWHYYLGLLRQRAGRREESVTALERALELAPSDPASLLRLADQQREGENFATAEELYRRLLHQPATTTAGLKGLAQVATARGDHAKAAERYERALAAQPSATRLHYLLALAYRRLGDMDRARQQIALQGQADVAFPDPLLAELSALASGAAVSLQRGYYADAAGFADSAIEDYRRAVAADPTNPEARRSLAGALADSGDHQGAIEQLRELLKIDPNPAGAHFTLAQTLGAAGHADEALAQLWEAVAKAPDFRNFRLALAQALASTGQLAESAGHLQSLLEVDEHDVEARIGLAEVRLAAGELEEAATEFRAALDGDPAQGQRVAAHHGLAQALNRSGDLAGALRHYEATLELAPEFHVAQLGLAALLGGAGRYLEAAAAFRRALELDPQDEPARLGEATALLLAGDPATAAERLAEGLALLPESAQLADTLARLLAAAPEAPPRDGAAALAIARPLFERQPTLRHAETLAMALAETGEFEEAIRWQERVVAEAVRAQDPALEAAAERILDGYLRGEPYRLD